MIGSSCSVRRKYLDRLALGAALALLATARPPAAAAQGEAQTGTIAGTVRDEQGTGLANAQIYIPGTPFATQTGTGGSYALPRVPAGTVTLHARLLGYRPDSASVTVTEGQRTAQDFSLRRDPLQLQEVVVTGTQTPRINLDASVAVTTITPAEIQQAAPRSTTEVLRYVPGFTRVESSGGEVNENYTIRGILGVEYVMFMEDGMPVFPTMHTFFMNADNLFRLDENIERLEVVRGGASALFGSNTPGAIINFINKTGGDHFQGTTRAQAGTQGLARYDLNMNGPIGSDWRFNLGGFYRYDHGVRDPGFPGIRGGQVKGSVTRLLQNGYLRFTAKLIDDRNQFILDLPHTNANGNPEEYVPGFGNYGSMNTPEGLDLRVPTPTGDLTLPLDNGLKTSAQWFTADASFDLTPEWHLQNTAQIMWDRQEWNAMLPFNTFTSQDYITAAKGDGGLGFPAGSVGQYVFTNVFDPTGAQAAFNTPNNLVSPGGEWHVSKPISAIHDQVQLRRQIGPHSIAFGAYAANYTQDNHWFFTNVLTNVQDIPHFLDLVVTPPGGTPVNVTKNGFSNFLSNYVNGSGQTSIFSGVGGAEVQLTDKLRADLGGRVEYDNFVQSAERTSTFDLDGNPATTFDNETFGNGSFNHFGKSITDWAASLGLNYKLRNDMSVYASAARGYKMPALDEFLNAQAAAQVDLFESRQVQTVEGGVKGSTGRLSYTVNGFYTRLKHIVSQGAVLDSTTGATTWIIVTSPVNNAFGAEVELVATPVDGLQIFGNTTILKAELGTGAGADIGSRINGVPTSVSNLSAIYSPPSARGFQVKGDWHWVDKRPVDITTGNSLPAYSYFNFGASYTLPSGSTTISADLLNAFQNKGLEEGNPRIQTGGGSLLFNARPILPRRFTIGVLYNFGGLGAGQASGAGTGQ